MKMSHFVFDLTCDVTGDTGVNFFQLHLNDLVQYSLLKLEFFRHFYWLPREMGGGDALQPPAEGRGWTRPNSARSMDSLYNLSYFVKS